MNIDINILPAELRPKALLDTKTFVLIVVILLLAVGCFYFGYAKSSSQADMANMQSQITAMQQQTNNLTSNSVAADLIKSINQIKATKQSYDAFVASKVLVGDALKEVYSLVPFGVDIGSITQHGDILTINGSSQSYAYVSDFGRALDNDSMFTLVGMPSFSGSSFTLTISVATGGAR